MGAGIIAATFISEDGATVTAATLAASSLLDARLAFVSAFSGLWVGDLGVYAIARYLRPPRCSGQSLVLTCFQSRLG